MGPRKMRQCLADTKQRGAGHDSTKRAQAVTGKTELGGGHRALTMCFQREDGTTAGCARRTLVTPVMRLLMCEAVVRMTAMLLRLPKWHVMRSFCTCT